MKKCDEAAADVRIVSDPVVRPDVGIPEIVDAGTLGPKAQHVVVVVRENDAPARLHGADHRFHDAERIGNMLEDEARVREVE